MKFKVLNMYDLEDDNEVIPTPTLPENIQVSKSLFVAPITAWMPMMRDEMLNKAVKKTLTIPKWLNDEAESKKVNFPQILQSALKEYLNITHH